MHTSTSPEFNPFGCLLAYGQQEIAKEGKMVLESFLKTKRIGLILRAFAQNEEQIPDRVAMVRKAIEQIGSMEIHGYKPIRYVNVVVWANPKYKDSDCGRTAATLKSEIQFPKSIEGYIDEFTDGDLFCGLLNSAVANQLRHRVDYSLVASSEAFSYMNNETTEAIIQAVCDGALAVGVAVNELTQSIIEGRLANTFAMWENKSLVEVGGFDLRAEKPINEQLAHYMRGWSKEKQDFVFYHLAGVEEVIPLARLTEKKGQCIAPILPKGPGIKQYQAPDPHREPDLWLRHVSKMGTKLERQTALLASIGCDPSFIKGGVMEKYRNF